MLFSVLCSLTAPPGAIALADHHGCLTGSAPTYPTSSDAYRTSWFPSRSLNNTGCAFHIDSVSQHPLIVPTTNVYRSDVLRPRSWCSAHDSSDKISIVFQGTVAHAPAWGQRLVHSVGLSYPHGYRVHTEPGWTTCAGRGRDVQDDPCVPLYGHTPRDNASNEFSLNALVSSRTDAFLRMNMTATRRPDTDPNTVDPVILRHLGALDGCFDFQRHPPRSPPPSEIRRGLYAWIRVISEDEDERTKKASIEAHASARRRARNQLREWAHNITTHHLALRVAENITAILFAILCPFKNDVYGHVRDYTTSFKNDMYGHVRDYLDCVRECLDAIAWPACAWPYRFVRWPLLEVIIPIWVHAYKGFQRAATIITSTWEVVVASAISVIIILYKLPAYLRKYGSGPTRRCVEYTERALEYAEAADIRSAAMRVIADVTTVQVNMLINNTVDFNAQENAIIFFSSTRLQRLGILLGRRRVTDCVAELFHRESVYWIDKAHDGGPRPSYRELYKCYLALRVAQALSATGRLLELAIVTTIYIPLDFYFSAISSLTAIMATVQCGLLITSAVYPSLATALAFVAAFSTTYVALGRNVWHTHHRDYLGMMRRAYHRLVPFRCYITFAAFCTLTEMVHAAPTDKGGISCPIFDGTSMLWTSWYITFTGWLAWKNPKLIDLINLGDRSCPAPADWNSPTDAETAEIEAWGTLNVQYTMDLSSCTCPTLSRFPSTLRPRPTGAVACSTC